MSTPDPTSAMEQFAATFREEAADLLTDVETTLLALETSPDDPDLIARAFRALHTIKGSSAMFGFTDITTFAHALETTFDEVRKGNIAVTPALVSLALQGKDLIRSMLDGSGADTKEACAEVIHALREMDVAAQPPAPAAPRVSAPRPPDPPAVAKTYRVAFQPQADLLKDGTNPLGLWTELLELGSGEVVATTDQIPPLHDLVPDACYVAWDAVLTTQKDEAALRDVFLFVEDRGALTITLADDGESDTEDDKKLGQILIERGSIRPEQLQAALAAQPRLGTILTVGGTVAPDQVAAALAEQRVTRQARAERAAGAPVDAAASVRVAADKLDDLVDLVGELVIAQSRLTQVAASRDDLELVAIAEDVERLTADLRDNTLNLRMVPIGSTFNRFKRLVRDLSTELGKQIDLVTDGAETELDKTVIERLGDPLVHIIRNSCDHGIESPADREASGKPPTGTVRLAAYQSGPNVIIEIHDDGAGLDVEAIREKAIARGLMAADASLSEGELFQLVFLAGFSTAKSVSVVSGRGVGMDVVKRSIDALRGTVELKSKRGAGTTLRIKLPLTLAIIDGLLVSVGNGRYVLPMSLVEECVEISRAQVEEARGAHLVPVRGELVPYMRLREWFHEEGEQPLVEQIAIASTEGRRFGFAVDDVIGQHQTVIKTMGRMYGDTEGLAGATILGDGTVALIVDVAGVIRNAIPAGPPPS